MAEPGSSPCGGVRVARSVGAGTPVTGAGTRGGDDAGDGRCGVAGLRACLPGPVPGRTDRGGL